MKINFLLLAFLIVTISSCSTAYKTGQTPDDVYYSPVHFQYDNDSVRTDRNKYQGADNTVYESTEDREIRRRIHNRRYRRYDERYDYPYGSNYPYSNSNPGYGKPQYGTPQNQSQPRKTNLGAYKPNTTNDSSRTYDPKFGNQNSGNTTAPVRTFGKPNNSSSNGTGVGNFIRRVFPADNNYNRNNSNNTTPSRTFDRSNNNSSSNNNNSNSSTNSSSNKSSSTSAPVRTFKNDQ